MARLILVLLLTGCCNHAEIAQEALRINNHLEIAAVTTEGKAVARANATLWKEIK